MIQPHIAAGADLILTMEKLHGIDIKDFLNGDEAAIRLLGSFGGQSGNGEIADPYGYDLSRYRQTAMQIRACLEGVIQHIRQALSE
jgi:protein-tyrosine-phosphatase